ncbi:Plasmodium exported protein (hyp10), unknown, putative [Plasmodium sp. gorilla clade G1]|nr:Plasmodium exported protein (hyp10), unknown, putative [Plasmodium sp. gorilla clade G1]
MYCNYIKLSLFSIVLCIFIITHKLSFEQITHNNTNTVDVINVRHKRFLAESHETDIFKTHSGQNSLTQPIHNKLEENITEYHKTSSASTLSDEFLQKFYDQTKQIKRKNEKDNISFFQKFHIKSHFKKIHIIIITSMFLYGMILSIVSSWAYFIYKHKQKKL